MKRWFAGLSATFVMALSGLSAETSYAQSERKSSFYCGKSADGRYVTVFDNGRGARAVVINWVKRFAQDWNPERRCEQVSRKFQQNYQLGNLRYLVPGIATNGTGLPVICSSPVKVSQVIGCADEKIVMTLRPEDDSNEFLERLVKLNTESNSPLSQSYPSQYVDDTINVNVLVLINYLKEFYSVESNDISREDTYEDSPTVKKNDSHTSFACVTNDNIPMTVVRISKRDIPIIIWKSKNLTNSGLTPEQNCQAVSSRFENLRQKNALNYIIHNFWFI
ncbi:MAG: COP23 domain-containing protein [Pseudanabaena sp.]